MIDRERAAIGEPELPETSKAASHISPKRQVYSNFAIYVARIYFSFLACTIHEKNGEFASAASSKTARRTTIQFGRMSWTKWHGEREKLKNLRQVTFDFRSRVRYIVCPRNITFPILRFSFSLRLLLLSMITVIVSLTIFLVYK